MIATQLPALVSRILALNPYFDAGYGDVFTDERLGYMFRNPKDGSPTPVFPNDTLGDYFYLRMPQTWSFSNSPGDLIADGISYATLSGTVFLVAYVKNADADKLALNLITTLRQQGCAGQGAAISLLSASAQRDIVLLQELSGLSEEAQEIALQRLGEGITLVSVSFTYTAPLPFNTCITDPCKC